MTQARDLADGKFDTNTLVVDAANNHVGVGTASPSLPLHINGASAGDGLVYSRSGTEYFRIDDTGTDMNIKTTGGGHQIIFTTNSSEVGRWRNGGGLTFNGDTAAANALDDYEEGVFDPFSGIGSAFTNEAYVARYVKIGRIVHVDLQVQWTATDNSGNALQLKAPFTSSSSPSSSASTGAVFYSGSALFSGYPIVSHIGNNSNDISLFKGSGGSFSSVSRSDVNGTYDIRLAFTYEV